MRAEEIKGLMEAYSKVNETVEVLNEAPQNDLGYRLGRGALNALKDLPAGLAAQLQGKDSPALQRQRARGQGLQTLVTTGRLPGQGQTSAAKPRETAAQREARISAAQDKAIADAEKAEKAKANARNQPNPPTPTGSPAPARPPAPVSTTVLAKKGGVEGKLDKSTGKFTATKFTDVEKARYDARAPKPATPTDANKPTNTPTPAKLPGPSMDQWAKANPTLAAKVKPDGTQKGTGQSEMSKQAAELRDMQKASQMRQKGADVMGSNITSVRQDVEKFNKPENLNKKAPAGTALAAQQQKQEMQKLKNSPSADLKMSLDIFDVVKGYLLDEGYAETEQAAMVIMVNMSEEWRSEILDELYKGKHGQSEKEYMAGRSDAGKRISGDEKEGPASYASRWHKGSEPTKPGEKPKNVQKLAKWEKDHLQIRKNDLKKKEEEKKKVAKEGHALTIEDIAKLLDENREHDREMRKAAARERAEEKRDRKEEGKRSAKAPGRLGKSAGTSYADKEQLSIKGHDEVTKKSRHTVGNPFPEHVEYVDEAQEARENPEKHEENEKKEHEKKYGHVRGEKTPMPPRGDKRREEFEKWYAKQMGR